MRHINNNNGRKHGQKNQTSCGMREVKNLFANTEVGKRLPDCGRLLDGPDHTFQVDKKRIWKDDRSAAVAVRSGLEKVADHLIQQRVALCPRCRGFLFKGAGIRTLSVAQIRSWAKKSRERDAHEMREYLKKYSPSSQGNGNSLGDSLRAAGISDAKDGAKSDTEAIAAKAEGKPKPAPAFLSEKPEPKPTEGKGKKNPLPRKVKVTARGKAVCRAKSAAIRVTSVRRLPWPTSSRSL